MSRSAAEAASGRLSIVSDDAATDAGEPSFIAAGPAPRSSPSVPDLLALPPFDEYYLSYADRTVPCAREFTDAVGPSKNGIVRPILVSRGAVVGVWSHSLAVGRHADDPIPDLFVRGAATAAEVGEALDRYRRFVTA